PLEKPFPEEEPAGPGNSSGNKAGRSRDSGEGTWGDTGGTRRHPRAGDTRGCPRCHPCHSPPAPRPDVTFGDDVDDLVASLGLGSGADGAGNAPGTPGGQGLRKGRAGIQELLGGGSTGKTQEQPGKAEFRPDPKEQEQPGPGGGRDQPDFPFGSYEPSVASGTGRRRGRRFPVGSSSQRPSGATWLGLKDEDFLG
ncbi:FBF1 factor, partial [Donacobius atricapilla]|nr:FBF1 factor [Donacobius atricapilla]